MQMINHYISTSICYLSLIEIINIWQSPVRPSGLSAKLTKDIQALLIINSTFIVRVYQLLAK
jgi:hypothetical protein